jgi:HSP20 family protein
MDVLDKGEKFEVKVDLPGVKKEDIDVSVEGHRVSISARLKEEKEVKEGDRVLHSERSFTSYARVFELPVEVSDAGAEAAYDDGVLTLTLPKKASATIKRLMIH